MLLTSWVESMRVAFEKSRKATLNPRRRLQLRSVPSSARQKVQRRIAIEQLEDRTLLTSLIINQLTAGLGITLNNSVLDPDADGVSNFDTIIFEDLTIGATSGAGVSIDLDNLTFTDPFKILFDNVSITSTTGIGIDIELSNLMVDTIAIDSSTISGGVGNAFNVDLTNVILNEFNIIDSTLSGQAGAGVTVALNASTIEETSLRRSSIDGVSIDVTNGSILRHTTMADNSISGTSGNDGVSVNIVDSIAEELRLTNNNRIQGVSINVDDTAAGGAALLTELFIHTNIITGNTAGDGVRIDLNNVDQFVSISGNSITANNGHGIVFDQTDGDLSGDLSNNIISNNTGHGVFFTPTTTNPVPTGAGAPGVPAYAGIPGPTDKIDFAASRNEVQLITFSGSPSGGTYTISYTGQNGVTQTTAGILPTATASQVKAAMVAAFGEISVGDILVNGNFQDGYEIEFVNAAGGVNVNPLTVDVSGLSGFVANVTIVQDTSLNTSEIQHLEITGTPTFGTFVLNFLGDSITLPVASLNATDLETELNIIANNFVDFSGAQPFSGMPIQVVATASGFDIIFLDGGTMHHFNVAPVTIDAAGLRLSIVTEVAPLGVNPNKPAAQTIFFRDVFGTNSVPPGGGSFTLTFQGQTTGPILIGVDAAGTAANIEAALEALAFATTKTGIQGDFFVTGNYATGFVIDFNEIQHLSLFGALTPTFGTFTLNFLGTNTTPLSFLDAIPSNPSAALNIQAALNAIANAQGATGSPVSVVSNGVNGFDIIFLDSGSLANGVPPFMTQIPQITANYSGLIFNINIAQTAQGTATTNEQQLLRFLNSAGTGFPFTFAANGIDIIDAPAQDAFTLSFLGETTAPIRIAATPAATAANIDAALEALNLATGTDDFTVTGNFTTGFLITFQGAFANSNVPLLLNQVAPLSLETFTLVGLFDLTTVVPITGDVVTGQLEPFVDVTTTTTQAGVGVNEQQFVAIPGSPAAGSFTLDLNASGTGPVTIAFNATAAQVRAALESLDTIGVGNVLVTGSVASGGFLVEFIGTFRAISPGAVLDIDPSNLVSVLPNVTTVTQGTTLNEVQEVIVSGTPTGGDFTLSFNGATTAAIAYNANTATIIAALIALPTLNAGDVLVRGDALSGFEVEFVGRLATINVSQIIVDATNLTGAAMLVKTTSVGGYLRGIRGNTITGNTGAGIEVDLKMYTSFYADIAGNTISSNDTVGINLIAADPTILKSVDFSISVDGNTMDDNRGAGIAVSMQDTAAGDVSITNNTITGTRNDNTSLTPYAGDAIYIDLIGTDVKFEAYSQLRDLTIDGNFLGTDIANTTGQGNAGHGVGIHIEESTIIDRTQISNNTIANNVGDGVNFHREDDARVGRGIVDPIVGEERAVMIYSNTITGNGDGIDILAQNGSLTTTDFEIKDNVIVGNLRDGISLHAEADATIFADIIHNQIISNSMNGIESTTRTTSYFGTDRRDVAGTWIQNDISSNSLHGIRISGRIGNRVDLAPHLLFIGLDGVDPVTGLDRGNIIEANGLDGIQIAAHFDRVEGNVKIANNWVIYNQTGGIELSGEGLTSAIDNNLIAFNTGKGVDINSNGQTIFLRNNVITENTSDGLEVLSASQISHNELNFTRIVNTGDSVTSLTAIGNFIDNNGGRGVDLQTEEWANSDFIFGDGTETGANLVVSNGLEGFYVVTTASRGQDQDADSTDALDATGNVTNSDADMVLQINRNYIQDNGVNSGFTTTGLILRIGTMASTYDYTGQTPGSRVSVGDESSTDYGNGRSNVSVMNNEFEGNFGEDFYVESFTSTVDPPTTVDNWDSAATPPFRVLSSYRRDPLAKLNLVFQDNTGNGLNVVNVGAFYNNAEPVFKSRLANGTPAPNPDGPFNSATRRRNAQRVASRTNLAPSTAPNLQPTTGTVLDAFLASPGGPIQITTVSPHGLFSGDTVEIRGVASDELLGFAYNGLSPANGVFVVDVIDVNNFTLRSTDGAVIGNVSPGSGTWSSNAPHFGTNSFLYDGMGVSTFRIAQGFDGVNGSGYGDGFQQGDSFLNEANRPGTIFGELNFDWDIWVPNAETFLAPVTSTFLTADISVSVPDPTTGALSGPFTISFTEDVNGVDITDFVLLRNNVAVTLNAGMLTQINARTFQLDLSSVTGIEGEYDLRLNTNGSISDAKYVNPFSPLFGNIPSNFLMFGDVERFTVDTTVPTADIVDVSPDPRSDAAGEVVINFSEDVKGVDLSDFTISFNGGTPINLATTPATLTQVTGSQFILDISKVTSLSGTYTLSLIAAGSSITDLAGNALAANATDLWVNDTLAPIAQFVNVVDPVAPGNIPSFRITLNFSENVVIPPALSDFTLNDGHGNIINLSATAAVITQITPSQYEINLDTLADSNGIYTITYHAENSAVEDASGNEVAGSTSETWQKGLEVVAPTAGIQDITPDPRMSGEVVGIVTINFSEAVTGVDITDFELVRVDGTGTHIIPLEDLIGDPLVVTMVNASTYQINLTDVTALDGDYTLTLLADGTIRDAALNAFASPATDSWRTGGSGPVAMIQNLPDVLLTNAGIVTVTFDQAVVGAADISHFKLTLNGQNVSLAGLVVTPVSGTEYTIDLSSVTQAFGTYKFSLIAAGANIRNISGDLVLDDASETWVASSTIDLDLAAPVFTDGVDSIAGDGIVGNGTAGSQTLRAAIQEANALAGSNIIELAAGTYVLSIAGINEDQSLTGDLDIRDNLTIRGQGVGVTIIDAGALDRIFQIFAGVTLNLENLTITNGKVTDSDDGAGIRNSGTTTLTNVEVTANHAEDSGGGINNSGLMIIVDSTISLNTAGGSGGGIRNTGTLEVSRSTLYGNTTVRDGGALFNAGAGNVTLSNSTFSGNASTRSGGAIRNTATLTATNNTFTLNAAGTNGGAISTSGTSTLQNDLILGNTAASNAELDGAYTSLGGNLTGLIGSATGFGTSDILNVIDPTTVLNLNLADNGGPTLTHALVLGSAAIDAGVNAIGLAELEQRGSARILGGVVDIGAVEFGAFFVNSFLDTVDAAPGDGVAADINGNLTLRAAIMEANALDGDSVIILPAGTYYLNILNQIDSNLDNASTGDLDITDLTGSLTILGAGSGQTIISAAIDPSDIDAVSGLNDRVFDVLLGTELILQGVTVTGGTAIGGSGGGIRNIGRLSLVNTLVDGNAADIDGGGILNGRLGQQGTLNLTKSTVSNNTATDGGGIFNNDQSLVTLIDSAVTGNNASGDGGGFFNDIQATINLTRSSISNNTAVENGGGIYNNDLTSLTINDSKVNQNTAQLGAGIFNEEAAVLTVNRTTLSGNHALLSGGGIYNDEGVVSLRNISILNNMADTDGGGLYNASAGQVTITNGFFDDNSADRDGGAIANFGISLLLTGTTIRDSQASRYGGGLFNDQEEGAVSLVSTSLINNQAAAGAGIYNQELGIINLDLSKVLNNTASTNGGGIFNTADATLNLQRTTIDGNRSANDGAGIFNADNAQLNLYSSTVSNNTATHFGGGVYNSSVAIADIVNTTISGNEASSGGGVYNNEEGSMEITNATIFNNNATVGGGVLNATDGFVSVANSIIAGNSSVSPGPDVTGDFFTRGNNLVGVEGVSVGFADGVKGDLVGSFAVPVSPGLGALQDNGGATFTHELLGGSLARDAGNNFYAPTDDQRGFARLFDGDGNGSLIVDIGAFESGYIVTGFGDSVDANPGDGVSVDINGQSTLRAAIIEANARLGADTILLGTGTYTLSLFGLGENNAFLGDLDITDDLTIIGAGSDRTIIDADFLDRIFHIFTGVNVSIRGVTLINGDVTRVEDGGAILNYGNLTLDDVEIRDSLANRGGALFNNGVVTITNSLLTQNIAITDGGAIFNNNGGTVTVNLSTISNNNAENGGGIYNAMTGTLEIIDTTLDANTATVAGGAVYNSSEVATGNGEGGDGIDIPLPPDPDPDPTPLYSIEVVFIDNSLTASQQAIFQLAAARWSEIIIADVPDVFISGIGLVDDLRIEASAPFIDGVNGILGQAGPDLVRTGTFIPATGTMAFDSADVAALEANGQLLDVILHEMGHVIGIGTIWQSLGLLLNAGTSDPRFTGTNAVTQYNQLLGRNVTDVPVEGSAGPGTNDAHWRETDLTNELMTGFLDPGLSHPISTVTIGSLADIGYVVDLSVADSYPLQAPTVQSLNSTPIGQMLAPRAFTVLDASSLVAVEAGAGTVTISNSTISNNFAGTRGGGLLNEDPISLSNVTFSGNEAGKEGGAIHNTGELTINNTTIYDNFTEGTGGGIYSVAASASVNIRNTIVAGNNALLSGADVTGVFTSDGHNLIGTRGVSAGFINGFNDDIVGSNGQRIDPVLSPLQDNGGPTFTHALLVGSLAIDAGDNTDGVVIDQRGATRPTDTTSDIGAFEIVTPSISIVNAYSQLETDSGNSTVFEIVVTLSNPNVDAVTVKYETSNGTAEAGIDYNFTTGTITFAPGETTQIIQVIVIGDDIPENNETFYVNLFDSTGAAIANSQSVVTILNDEAVVSINDVSANEGPQGVGTNFNFTVTLSHPVTDVVTLDVATLLAGVGNAFAAADDFVALNQTLTFNPGESLTQTVTVVVNGDSAIEDDEIFHVELSNLNVAGSAAVTISDSIGEGEIKNDDKALLSVSDVTLTENFDDPNYSDFIFTVSLSQPISAVVTVDITTVNGTATVVDGDYVANSTTLTFDGITFPGITQQNFTVRVLNDSIVEGLETFFVELSNEINANIADGQGVGTIVDNGIVVTTLDDVVNAGDGVLSLREAINMANVSPGLDYIILPNLLTGVENIYRITMPGAGENNNATGDFDIRSDVTIFGQGAGSTIIDAGGLDRIFHIVDTANNADVSLSNLKLRNGDADDGGAILSEDRDGSLTLNQVIFENNNADFLGGAILNAGQLDISDSQFLNNHAGFQGGALYQYQGIATVARTIFADNASDGRAGAVYVGTGSTFNVSQSLFNNNDSGSRGGAIYSEGTVSSSNSTYSANHSGSRGGAIFNDGVLNVLNNTLTLNTADQSGGGISNNSAANSSAVVTLVNTIVAGNTGTLGNDDVGGAFNGSYNLIGNIGAATGLTDGVNGNIVGSFAAPIDPKLGILLDNGGPTRTHTLLYGSAAIDAGNTGAVSIGAVDQIGNPRVDILGAMIVDIGAVELVSPPSPPLLASQGDVAIVEDQTNIQISVVTDRTTVSSDGHTYALPANEDWIDEWQSFWVEVWVDTATGYGISDVLTNIAYNTDYFTATAVEFGSNFAFNRTVIFDDAAGMVRNLGASTNQANVGEAGYALLARIKFESLAGDQVKVDPTNLIFAPLELGLDVLNTKIGISGVGEVVANVGALPQTDLYPVIYDINDDDAINFRDLTFLAAAYNQEVFNSTSQLTAVMDFNKNGRVDFKDLSLMAANYNKKKGGSSGVSFPENFGQTWIGTTLNVVSGDDSIDQVIKAAVNTWETALGLEEPLDVQVIVRDFGSAQLGSGQATEYNVDGIPVGGRVVIDNDANGLGWHVDVTDLPSSGGYDLYTVLLHEIGHVLGFTRYYSGFGSLVESNGSGDLVFVGSNFTVALDATGYHIDDSAYLDDLMNDTLDPGVRKTPSALNIQMLLEAYESAQGGTGSGGTSSPIYGTNTSPAAVAEPVIVQSSEAAQVFVDQSTVDFVAPAAIKTSDEDDSLVDIRQVATFDVIQPSVLGQITEDGSEFDETIFEDLYSSGEFEEGLSGSDADDRQLVFAHAADELDLADDFDSQLESMDEAFTNWEGPLL
tara:strand:+ start:270 stop:17531 length:17262 start_codon:yes stop_codon:yes gene_type:complete